MYAKIFVASLLLVSTSAFAGLDEAQLAIKKGDYPAAIKEYTLLAEVGDVTSQFILGVIYSEGKFATRNDKVAEEWLRKAALQNNSDAQYLLGDGYEFGKTLGLAQDYALAAEWYFKAAGQGVVNAQVRLGYFYSQGLGVTQNYYQAIFWYNRAAQASNVEAQAALGDMNYFGKGFPQNYQIAAIWLRQAAAQNHADSQALLGSIYQDGKGTSKNPVLAYALYNLALAGNTSIKTVAKEQENIARQMTPSQVEESTQLVKQLSTKDNFNEALNSYLAQQ